MRVRASRARQRLWIDAQQQHKISVCNSIHHTTAAPHSPSVIDFGDRLGGFEQGEWSSVSWRPAGLQGHAPNTLAVWGGAGILFIRRHLAQVRFSLQPRVRFGEQKPTHPPGRGSALT